MDIEQAWWDTFGDSCGVAFETARPDYHTLDPRTRRFGALMKLELDLYNGGFLQFFCNWGHAAYLLALEGLEQIRATRAKEILKQAYAIIERYGDDERLEQLWDLPAVLTEAEARELDRLDQLYWEDEDGIMERMLASYAKNAPADKSCGEQELAKGEASRASEVVLRRFEPKDQGAVIDIYNHYVRAGTAAFASEPVSGDFFDFLLDLPAIYPAYVLAEASGGRVVGFCFLSPFHPQPTFRKTALVDYFIAPDHTGKGLGSRCLGRLEEEAGRAGIAHIIAEVSGENRGSIAFHERHGFRRCGVLEDIGHKLGRDFGVVYMQKDI